MTDATNDLRVGLTVVHRRYVPYSHAHYAGSLVDGAYGLGLFGDVATDLCIRTDGDEGLFASYDDVQFLTPVRAGDVVEVTDVEPRGDGLRLGATSRLRVLAEAGRPVPPGPHPSTHPVTPPSGHEGL